MLAGLYESRKPRERVAPFQKQSHAFHVPLGKDNAQDRRQEMQGLAAEKIHGPERFQKEDGWGGHSALDNHIGRTLEQREIGRRKRLLRLGREGVPKPTSKPAEFGGHIAFRK